MGSLLSPVFVNLLIEDLKDWAEQSAFLLSIIWLRYVNKSTVNWRHRKNELYYEYLHHRNSGTFTDLVHHRNWRESTVIFPWCTSVQKQYRVLASPFTERKTIRTPPWTPITSPPERQLLHHHAQFQIIISTLFTLSQKQAENDCQKQ